MAGRSLLGEWETMGHSGYLTNRLPSEELCLPYSVLIRLRQYPQFSFLKQVSVWISWAGKGRRENQRFCLSLLFLNKQLETNIPKSNSCWQKFGSVRFGIMIWHPNLKWGCKGWEIQHVPIPLCQVSWNTLCLFSWYHQNVVKVWEWRECYIFDRLSLPKPSFSVLLASVVPHIWPAVRIQDLGKKSEK